jgi:hypothetical protein
MFLTAIIAPTWAERIPQNDASDITPSGYPPVVEDRNTALHQLPGIEEKSKSLGTALLVLKAG